MESPRLLEVTATLRADDVGALAAWYRDALGFEIQMLWGEPATYSRVRRDAAELGIGQLGTKSGPASVYVILRGVDVLYAEFRSRDVRVSREPEDQPYRMRDFELVDPEGNRITFGEVIEFLVGRASDEPGE
jgi:catechol 2,3-dioxygenase-like lactoylglutathione lyase family enzyme